MAQAEVKTIIPVEPATVETVPVFLTEDAEKLVNECFEAMGITDATDKRDFFDNASLAFAKAQLRAHVNKWNATCHKYGDSHPAMSGAEVELACQKINKNKYIFEAAKMAEKILADKF
jgi:hypothetical protein